MTSPTMWKAMCTGSGVLAARAAKARLFTFVTVREQYKIREIIRYTKARIQPGQLPTLRDVSNIRTSKLLDEVRQTLAESSGSLAGTGGGFPDRTLPGWRRFQPGYLRALAQTVDAADFGNQDNVGEVDELTMSLRNAPPKCRGEISGRQAPAGRSPPYVQAPH